MLNESDDNKRRLVAAAMISLCSMSSASARQLLHPMFQDHAVLQRDRSVRIWGEADPGAEVAVARDVQRRVVQADPHAALAVSIDVGDRYDIHPTNKQQVGRRLALAARRLIHGEDIVASGPSPSEVSLNGGHVVVRFSNAASGLVVYGGKQPIGFELCDDENRCEYVDATVQDDRVLLEIGSIGKPSRVRYGWADSPICNLYNQNDLPAVPFEIRIQR